MSDWCKYPAEEPRWTSQDTHIKCCKRNCLAHKMESEAMKLMFCGEFVPHVTQPQTSLILAFLHLTKGSLATCWILLGHCIYSFTELHNFTNPGAKSSISERNKRLLSGIFVLETLVAFRLGRRTYLRTSGLKYVRPLSTDSIDEWESWKPLKPFRNSNSRINHQLGRIVSTFNALIDITCILNDILHTPADHSHEACMNKAV